MKTMIYVPNDTTARSLGADEVARAILARVELLDLDASIVRNGSRGMSWAEPLLELDSPTGRIGFSNVTLADVPSLFASGLPDVAHPKCMGIIDRHPWLARQSRLTFRRTGVIDPLDFNAFEMHGGLTGLRRALTLSPQAIVDEIKASGVRGRGGAAFPAHIKWQTVKDAVTGAPVANAPYAAHRKFVLCNADEGDSGTFADRLLVEADPFQLIEGMCIAGLATGATLGFIYLRSEYPHAEQVLRKALAIARARGLLGTSMLGSPHGFDIELRIGAGAYVCGEETSIMESIEGRRPLVRAKPPLPATCGLFGRPTLVHNVLTLAATTTILADGGGAYAQHGSSSSRGTFPFQLAGNIARGGIVELPFGVPLNRLLEEFGGGSFSGRPLKAIQVGGPLGAYLPSSLWNTPLEYESLTAINALLGHGGIVAFDDSVDLGQQAEFAFEFCAHESCGKCTPCRIGARRGSEVIKRLRKGENPQSNLRLLQDLCNTMEQGSLCALGGLTPMPVRSVLDHFRAELMREERSQ